MGHAHDTLFSDAQAQNIFFEGDPIFVIDGVSTPCILRETNQGRYRMIKPCYLWAALDVNYWNSGTKKGRWETKHYDHDCEQTQTITIY
jgi:hypothetical protein